MPGTAHRHANRFVSLAGRSGRGASRSPGDFVVGDAGTHSPRAGDWALDGARLESPVTIYVSTGHGRRTSPTTTTGCQLAQPGDEEAGFELPRSPCLVSELKKAPPRHQVGPVRPVILIDGPRAPNITFGTPN